ncbi:hypothetical protein HZA73_01905 [candidate division TA06 bacterium]|nr:hypothetical protein [candidate division TA06 bacterium]
MSQKKENIPAEIQVAIAAALGRYLKDDKLAFHVASIKPVHHSEINLWALAGRQENMGGPRK